MSITKVSAPTPLPPHRVRIIATAALVDPKTVTRVLIGAPTRPSCRERVETALRAAGLAHLLPNPDDDGEATR